VSEDHPTSSATTARVDALEDRLAERGLLAEGDVDAAIERLLARAGPAQGARVVARAWVDPDFRARLLEDATEAIAELDLSMRGGPQPQRLVAVENTADVHNVIVCTLCSCYPIALLGPSPSWYKSLAYRSRVVREPRAVLAEFGLDLPPDTAIRVWDSSSELRYLVVPRKPQDADGKSEGELARLVTRDGMIGTALR
jgi:nitrile hydratase subunit alpha